MTKKKNYDKGLVRVGKLIKNKRISLGNNYDTRENFINNRSEEIFNGKDWMSVRHLANIELGKNWLSIKMLLMLATALEENPVDFFEQILISYQNEF